MSIEIQCMTEKLIVITIKLDYSKVPKVQKYRAHHWLQKFENFGQIKIFPNILMGKK